MSTLASSSTEQAKAPVGRNAADVTMQFDGMFKPRRARASQGRRDFKSLDDAIRRSAIGSGAAGAALVTSRAADRMNL
jgi:hypothetical protein